MNWKKTAKVGGISLVTVAALGYGLLFTKPGNSAMAFYVESLLNTDPNVPITVEEFTMTTNQLNLQLKVSDLIDTNLDGKFSLFSGNFDGDYTMSIDDLSRINVSQLKDLNARGSFKTQGKINSTDEGYTIVGSSKMYEGDLNYDMLVDGTELQSLNFRFDNLSLKNMLKHSGQMQVADADIVIDGKIKNAQVGSLDGVVTTSVKNGSLNSYIMKKMYGKDIPEDFTFSVDVDTKLFQTKAISKLDIKNSYSTFNSDKLSIDLETEKIDGDYKLEIVDVSKFAGEKTGVQGGISTSGKVTGRVSNAIIQGKSDLYGSDTQYTITMNNDTVKSIDMDIVGISLKELAKQSGQKASMDGKLNVKIDIPDAREGQLDGRIVSNLTDVNLDKSLMKQQYDMDIPSKLNLKAENVVKLKGDEAIINSTIETAIASLKVNNLLHNFKNNSSQGSYVLQSASMKDLVGLSGIGSKLPKKITNDTSSLIVIKGNIQGGNNPIIDGKTDFLNGELNFKYANNLLNVNLVNSGINLKKDNKIVYDSNANANIKYNTKTNKVDLIFSLEQSDTKVDVKKAVFDLKKNRVFANVDFKSMDKNMNYLIQGDMDNPAITLKAEKPLISQKYVQFLKNEIKVNLEDKQQQQNIYKVLNILSKPNAVLTKKDMLSIESGVEMMVESLKQEYGKFKDVKFTKTHFDNLQNVAEKLRKEKNILSDADIQEIERRSKEIVNAVQTEWNSSYQKQKREEVLTYFSNLGKQLESGELITKEEMDKQKIQLSSVLDNYQSIISDKTKIDKELQKYNSVIKIVKLMKKDEKFDKEKFYELIADFNNMLDFVQYKIANTDTTDEHLEMINKIAKALQEKSEVMRKL